MDSELARETAEMWHQRKDDDTYLLVSLKKEPLIEKLLSLAVQRTSTSFTVALVYDSPLLVRMLRKLSFVQNIIGIKEDGVYIYHQDFKEMKEP